MRWVVAALMCAAPASAQVQSAAKLVILWGNGGIAITDYPSVARCEIARRALRDRAEKEIANRAPKQLEGGGMIMSPPWQMETVCIPG